MFGLYIHIPYCRSKCRYCDFYSTPCPDGVPEAYIDALCREMDRFSPCGSTPLRPDTLYFGGGTPSLLTPAQAARLIRAAGPAPGAEITLEANPETVTPERLAAFRRAGVNRLSLGIQ
ncbi:MAG: radical SAM protein, partial [Ruthenibacterium lactatiformans]